MNYSNAIPDNAGKPPGGLAGFDAVDAAPEYTPLPPGIYTARIVRGECCTTKAGDDAYRMRFEVVEGEQHAKTIIRTWTFGTNALPYTKRDLAPFDLTSSAELLSPFPAAGREYLVRLEVVLQRGNDGTEWNDIKRIEILKVTESPAAAFMLKPPSEGGTK